MQLGSIINAATLLRMNYAYIEYETKDKNSKHVSVGIPDDDKPVFEQKLFNTLH